MIETARLTLSAWTEAERAPFAAMCADAEVQALGGRRWDTSSLAARLRPGSRRED